MAKSDLDVRIKLGIESKEYRDALRRANAEAKEFKKQQKDAFKAAGDGATSNFGKVIAMAKKVAPAVTAGLAAAIKVANDAIKENQTLTDEWARVTESAKAVWEGFVDSLVHTDFGGYHSSMSEVIRQAREAADAMDRLGTTQIFTNRAMSEYELNIRQARSIIKNPNTTAEEKEAAGKTIEENQRRQMADAERLSEDYMRAFASKLADYVTRKGFSVSASDFVEQGDDGRWRIKPGSLFEKYYKDLATYERKAAEYATESKKQTYFMAGPGSGGYIYNGNLSKEEWAELSAFMELSDEKLKETFELYANAQQNLSKIYTAQVENFEYLNKAFGGGTTTTSKKERPPEGSIAHIDQQIAEWGEKLKLETEDAGRAAAQAMIDELSAQKDKMVTDAKTASIEPLSTVGLSYSLGPVAQMPTDNSGIGRADVATEKFKFTTEEVEAGMETLNTIFSETSSIISALSDTSMKANKKIAAVLSSIGSIISAVGGGPIGKLFGGVGSIIGSFDTGGIVGGTSYKGDRLTANVSSGEMILNRMQQRNLFNALQGGGAPATATTVGVRGEDVYIALNNYMRRTNKSI